MNFQSSNLVLSIKPTPEGDYEFCIANALPPDGYYTVIIPAQSAVMISALIADIERAKRYADAGADRLHTDIRGNVRSLKVGHG